MGAPFRCLAACIVAALLAGPEVEEEEGKPRDVSVHIIAGESVATPLASALPDFLGDLPATHRIDRVDALDIERVLAPPDPPAEATAFVDLTHAGEVRIFIVDRDATHVFIRTLSIEQELDVVAIDEIGHLLESAFDALLAGGTVGITRAEATKQLLPEVESEPSEPMPPVVETSTAKVSAAPPRPSWTLVPTLTAGFAWSYAGERAHAYGPLVAVMLSGERGRLRPGGALEGRLYVPIIAAEGPLALRLGGGGLRLRPSLDVAFRGPLSLAVELGIGVDFLRDEAIPRGEMAEANAPTLRANAMADAAVGPTFRLGRGRHRVALRLLGTVDVALFSHVYRATDTGDAVLEPWIVRPGLRVHIGWSHVRAPSNGAW